jgi:hypothetical protein
MFIPPMRLTIVDAGNEIHDSAFRWPGQTKQEESPAQLHAGTQDSGSR